MRSFCYGWLQMVDTRFALVAAVTIHAVASLDVAAAQARTHPGGGAVARVFAR